MAGYSGYSMSNNAISAYESGEKPLSKWTKTEMLKVIKEEMELKCDFDLLKKVPVAKLKELCLYKSSWHHTSSHFNQTDFYSLNFDDIEELTNGDIDKIINSTKTKVAKKVEAVEKWRCSFIEWSGSRNYPRATEYTEIGIVKGDWFFRENGSKKKTSANGFKFIEKIN